MLALIFGAAGSSKSRRLTGPHTEIAGGRTSDNPSFAYTSCNGTAIPICGKSRLASFPETISDSQPSWAIAWRIMEAARLAARLQPQPTPPQKSLAKLTKLTLRLIFLTQEDRTLNANPRRQPETEAERITRHMRMCAELAELGMDLARIAAARARADAAEREKTPAAEPQSNNRAEPQSNNAAAPAPESVAQLVSNNPVEPPLTQASQPLRPRAPATTVRASSCKPIDPSVLFIRLAATVRYCMELERRLAAGLVASVPQPTAAVAPPADPRRETLRDAFRLVTKNLACGTELLREATRRLDEQLAGDPDQARDIQDLFSSICDDAGIAHELAEAYRATGAEHVIDPRATPPP